MNVRTAPLAALPALTLIVVGLLVLGPGAPRAVPTLRVYGGPTDTLARWTGWAEVGLRDAGVARRRIHFTARARDGTERVLDAVLDADSRAQLAFDFGRAPGAFELSASDAGRSLGAGEVSLTREQWLAAARCLGGFVHSPASRAGLALAVAPDRGAFAVPFTGELLVVVTRAGAAAAGVEVRFASDGARVEPARAETDPRGLVRVRFTPREHVVTLRVSAIAGDERAELFTSMPVVPGAMQAELHGRTLQILAPPGRENADVAVISEEGRWFGARVALAPAGAISRATLALPELPSTRLWAVLATDAAMPSPAAVGWPLFERESEPSQTLDAVDRELFDSGPTAERAERARRARVQRLALLAAAIGGMASVISLLRAARRSQRRGHSELAPELGERALADVLPQRRSAALIGAALIIAGFLVLIALFAWRLR